MSDDLHNDVIDLIHGEEIAVEKERRLTQREIEQRRRGVMKGLLDTRDGREFLSWVLFDLCGTANAVTPEALHLAHYRAGERGIGLTLQKQALQSAPALYMVLLTEHAHKL